MIFCRYWRQQKGTIVDAHRGQLFVEGAKYGLAASVSLDTEHLRVTTVDRVRTWPVQDTTVIRWKGNQFKLAFGDDELYFTADAPLGFTTDIVERLAPTRPRRGGSKRLPRMRRRPSPRLASTEGAGRERIGPRSASQADTWTDLVSGREESRLRETLAELIRRDKHVHGWESADDRADRTHQVCHECREVSVDLNAAEAPDRSRSRDHSQ